MKTALLLIPFAILALLLYGGWTRDSVYMRPPADEIVGGAPLPEMCEGWAAEGREWFPADRMYEKINGHASLYIHFGVEGMVAATWEKAGAAWDMTLFVMSNTHSSTAVFAHEKPRDARMIECADQAYAAPGTLIARSGPYYVQFVAHQPDAAAADIVPLAEALLESMSGDTASDHEETTQLSLPETGRLQGTRNVSGADAFGFTSLKNVTHAQYVAAGTTATWYYAEGDPSMFDAYTNELHQFGATQFFDYKEGYGAEMFGAWNIITRERNGIRGVRNALSRDAVESHWNAYIE